MAEGGARFWYGLALGAAVGAGGTWVGMTRPWQRGAEAAESIVVDAGPVEVAKQAKARKKRRGGRGRGGSSSSAGGDEPEAPPPPALTAADRAVIHRGPAISLPRRDLDLGSDDAARPLDAGEINDVIRRSSGPILDCIEEARVGAVDLRGEVRLEMLVDGRGQVGKVRVGAPRWLHQHGFADCATAAVRRWSFPSTGAPTVVDAPYHIE